MNLDRSQRRWRRAFFALLVVWLGTLGVGAYAVVDQAVSLTYRNVSYRDLVQDAQILARLAPVAAPTATREALLSALRRQHPAAFITADDSTVRIGQLRFVFGADGRLRAVRHPDLDAAPGA